MKTYFGLMKVLSFFTALILLISCHKLGEFFPGGKPPKDYRIKSITFRRDFDEYQGNFYYNKWGNPDSVIFGLVGTSLPNMYFIYNNKKQVTEYRAWYTNGYYEEWHQYSYTGNVITADTTYVFGLVPGDPFPDNYYTKRVNYFVYDSYGRIIKETLDFISPDIPSMVFEHQYGPDGNRIRTSEGIVYDDYLNPHALHTIWQFIGRDYSINNPIPATSYNSVGLPLNFNQPFAELAKFSFVSGARSLEQATIVYEKK